MIKHLRIDNRLIHGQVAVTWRAHVGAQAIIVCNDQVAADPIQKMALPMAARGSKVLVFQLLKLLLMQMLIQTKQCLLSVNSLQMQWHCWMLA